MKRLVNRLRVLARVMRTFLEWRDVKEEDLRKWVQEELGRLDALEKWQDGGIGVPPKTIYHVAAATLPVSLWQTLVCGLVLGAKNYVKLPTGVDEAAYRKFSDALPKELRDRVEYEDKFSAERVRSVDAVVVLGENRTLAAIRALMEPHQRFVGYGTKFSFLCGGVREVSKSERDAVWRHAARDVLSYGHAGCLAPRGIFLAPGEHVDVWCEHFSAALEKDLVSGCGMKISRAEAIQMQGYRATAYFKSKSVYPAELSCRGFTLVVTDCAGMELTDVPLALPVVALSSWDELRQLDWAKHKISTVGWMGRRMPKLAEEAWRELGATRFCKAGRMQQPSVFWKHDGDYTLRPFMRWIQREEGV